jgi:hypothetical protein
MKNRHDTANRIRPMLAAMERSIDKIRQRRCSPAPAPAWTGSSEGTTSSTSDVTIGSSSATASGKPKARAKSASGSFFRERDDTWRKAS